MGSRLGEFSLLVCCSLGVFFSYLIYGLLQEKLTKSNYGPGEKFNYFFSLMLFQCMTNSFFSAFALYFKNERKTTASEWDFALCGFTYIGAMLTSNYSLKFVSYPVQVISKSIKPIPVLILHVLWARRKYPLRKYLFIVMISVGVALFMYKGKASVSSQLGWGEFLLMISLMLDGFTGGIQESMRKFEVGSYTLMLHMNLWSIVYLSAALLVTGESSLFVHFARAHPEIIPNMIYFGLASAIGQIFLFTLLTNFGSLTCAIVTTTRKFFTVLASIMLFSHVMTHQQWIGTILVFSGIFLDQFYSKSKKMSAEKHENDSLSSKKQRSETL
ncbi:Solute carrier family 35 member B1 [Fasciolopsis buskii]|uniref:Solute carrier family 35 member B1 n=1 Tax=Fasciolopsis buskii TaxID=27845 RepID=A0A8E0RUV8_9TREM|nr:Solute carrier family 35 member B1 [Fasciolopsis buski]